MSRFADRVDDRHASVGCSIRTACVLATVVAVMAVFASRATVDEVYSGPRNTLMITVDYPNADHGEIERTITIPLEEQLSRVSGLQELRSITSAGRSLVQARFHEQVSPDAAFLEARELVTTASLQFPGAAGRPVINRGHLDSRPVFIVAVPPDRWNEPMIRRRFDEIEGVGRVELGGITTPEIHIHVEPERLPPTIAHLSELTGMVQGVHSVFSAFPGELHPLSMDTRTTHLDRFAQAMISPQSRIEDLATVEWGVAPRRSLGSLNGESLAIVIVHRSGNASTVATCRRLRTAVDSMDQAIVLLDRGSRIEKSLREVGLSVAIGCVGIFLVVLIAGRSYVAGAVSAATVLFSALAGLAALGALGIPLTVTTLAAVAVSAGLSVDTALFFLDSARVHRGNTVEAAHRMAAPILFSSATTVVVFVPILFAPGAIVDRIGGLAAVIAVSICASCIFVLAFVPHLVPTMKLRSPAILTRSNSRRYCRLLGGTVRWASARYRFVLVGAGILILISAWTTRALLATGLPPGDPDLLSFQIDFPAGTTVGSVRESARPLERTAWAIPAVQTVIASYEAERARFELRLQPGSDHRLIRAQLIRSETSGMSGTLVFTDDLRLAGGSAIPVLVRGPEQQVVQQIAVSVADRVQHSRFVEKVLYQFKPGASECTVTVDPLALSRHGIDPRELYSRVRWMTGREVIGKWHRHGQEVDVVMSSGRQPDSGCLALADRPLLIRGKPIPLGQLAIVADEPGYGVIERHDRARSARLLVFARDRRHAYAELNRIVEELPVPFPYVVQVDPNRRLRRQELTAAAIAVGLALFLVAAVLMIQFQQIGPLLLVFLQMPATLSVPLLVLAAIGSKPDIAAITGLLLCCGSSVNNSILILDARHGSDDGARMRRAIHTAARPIRHAAATTVIGVAPLMVQARSSVVSMLGGLSLLIAAGTISAMVSSFVLLPALDSLRRALSKSGRRPPGHDAGLPNAGSRQRIRYRVPREEQ